jgi:hypothetical protein
MQRIWGRLDVRYVVIVASVAAPWLIPFSFGPSPAFIAQLVSWIAFGILVAAIRSSTESQRTDCIHAIAFGWVLAGFVSCCIAYLQYFGVSEGLQPWVSYSKLGEAYANLRQRNQFATLTNVALMVLALKSSVSQKWGIRHGPQYIAAILATGNAMSASRTGLVGLGLVVVFTLLWNMRLNRKEMQTTITMMGSAVLAYCIAAVVYPMLIQMDATVSGVFGRFQDNSNVCTSRLTLWSNVLHLIAQKPWFGWDWGELDYAHFITLYTGERFCEILDNAHNLPLHLAVELGIPVAAAFCGMCVWLVWRNKPWAEKDPTRQMAWGVLAVIGLHSMLEYPLWYGPFQLAVVLCIWLLWRTPKVDVEVACPPRLQGASAVRAATGAAAVALLALCAYVAWDYWRISQIYLPPAARHTAYQTDTLDKVQGSRLFRDQVQFAELTLTPLDEDNAVHIHALAEAMLHFSPEPRVVEKLIESAVMLHQDEEAMFYLQRYKAAFPAQHARWSAALKVPRPD